MRKMEINNFNLSVFQKKMLTQQSGPFSMKMPHLKKGNRYHAAEDFKKRIKNLKKGHIKLTKLLYQNPFFKKFFMLHMNTRTFSDYR